MNPNSVLPAVLACHPSTPCAAIRRLEVKVRKGEGKLALEYRLEGDIDALDIPPTGPAHRAHGLWQNTCCEAFIRGPSQSDSVLKTESDLNGCYYEFNFSPSTAWAAYHFTAYRQNMTELDAIEPVKIAVRQTAHWLELEASVNLESLTMPDKITKLRLGLSAVVKQKSGDTSYWALAHPKAKPDFHHPDSFAFELGPYRP